MDFVLLGFIVYLLCVLVIGIITYKSNKNHADYFIAGRKLNPWVVAFSERASGESAWLLLGLPGAALAAGFLEIWTAIGCIAGIIFSWCVIAFDLRVETENFNSITLPNFFAAKFGKDDKILRIVSMIIIIFFFTFYLAAQFNGAGKVLNVTFGLSQTPGILIGAIVIIFYTMMGGFFAVAWTDLIQGIIMIGALVILPLVGLVAIAEQGHSLTSAVSQAGHEFTSTVGGKTGWAAVAVVIGGLSWGLGYMGQPHLLTRFMSIKSVDKIKISRRIAIIWAIPAFIGAMLVGLVGLSLYGQGYFQDVEKVMPHLATTLLPAWLAGIFISGAIAAMMSTADSQLLVISSSVIEDFYHQTLKKEVTEKALLMLSRIVTIVVGLIGVLIALFSKQLIFSLVSYAWSGLGASFGPGLLLLLKWKETTKQGILAGMITGSAVTVIWKNISVLDGIVTHRFVAWVLAFIAVWLVSKITAKKEDS
ncbi:MAG: sodium/proline symporter [Candidatus Cloacimonadota bacterium]|nr:MAG: sodium/proline symporter [Candidatus Cloacimonadota bacterium]